MRSNRYTDNNVFVLINREKEYENHRKQLTQVRSSPSLSRYNTLPQVAKMYQINHNNHNAKMRLTMMKTQEIYKENQKLVHRLNEIQSRRSRVSSAKSNKSNKSLSSAFHKQQIKTTIRSQNDQLQTRVSQAKCTLPNYVTLNSSFVKYKIHQIKRHQKVRERVSKHSKKNEKARKSIIDQCSTMNRSFSMPKLRLEGADSTLSLLKAMKQPYLGINPKKAEQIQRVAASLSKINIKGIKSIQKLKLPNVY